MEFTQKLTEICAKDKTAKKVAEVMVLAVLLLVIASRKEGKLTSVLPELQCETLYIKNNAHRCGRVRN
jgi:hypothetical protein